MLRIVLTVLAVLVGLVLIVWLGLSIRPAPLPPVSKSATPATVPLPAGLPAPVERFYRGLYGDNVPLVRTAVISGRGTVRMAPSLPRLPVRFRFTHEAGQNYRHYIEVTFFGLPVAKINEHYVNGKERMALMNNVSENNSKLDQGGVLGMWAESIMWLPSVLITDPNVRWEPVDADTAWLVVPFGQGQERLLVRFDSTTGKISYWEAMRYKNGAGEKVLWVNGTWMDEGTPWAAFDVDDVAYNTEVKVTMDVTGP